VISDGDPSPIIQSGPLEVSIIRAEPEWMNQVKDGVGRCAKPAHIAGIGWNFRFHKDDIQTVPVSG